MNSGSWCHVGNLQAAVTNYLFSSHLTNNNRGNFLIFQSEFKRIALNRHSIHVLEFIDDTNKPIVDIFSCL
jgi:hypothetical protein